MYAVITKTASGQFRNPTMNDLGRCEVPAVHDDEGGDPRQMLIDVPTMMPTMAIPGNYVVAPAIPATNVMAIPGNDDIAPAIPPIMMMR